ncbi:MAG: extracellular solute-binding protein [Anaerolineae bacterium]|nr:extracellular solute-binding protein [Anaerolineae bacterium]
MAELELSIMSRGPTTVADLQPLLDQFETEQRVHVRLRVLNWDTAWADLLKVALYQYGPDVSEIGSTWLSSFVAMDALQPFIGSGALMAWDPSVFLSSSWQSGMLAQRMGEPALLWAIPWWADTRIVYYRRDLLAQAGVELAQPAFDSPEHLAQTLAQLDAAGVPIPWVVPTHQSRMTVHNVASWVWGAGGDFVTDDGRRVLFERPEAQAGMCAYLSLARFLAEPARGLDDTQSDGLFSQGQAAAAISGPWLLQFALPEVIAQVGMACPPGIPFVGGSHLVLWKHAVHDAAAIKLIRFLTSQHVQSNFGRRAGLLPTRHDVLANPPFSNDPLYQVMAQGLKMGRSFPSVPLWGLVEERLNEVLGHLWADLLADPRLDLEKVVAEHLESLARRLNLTLRSRQ